MAKTTVKRFFFFASKQIQSVSTNKSNEFWLLNHLKVLRIAKSCDRFFFSLIFFRFHSKNERVQSKEFYWNRKPSRNRTKFRVEYNSIAITIQRTDLERERERKHMNMNFMICMRDDTYDL